MKPLAIDLFCGLELEAKLLACANLQIEKFVTCRAEHPNHVALSVGHEPAGTPPLETGFMRQLDNTAFPARLARTRQVRVLPTQSFDPAVTIRSPRIVDLLHSGFSAMKSPALFARCFASAILRTIAAVRIWRRNVKMFFALKAITTGLRDVSLFAAPTTTGATDAWRRAIAFVWTYGDELFAAFGAKKIIHSRGVS